MPDLSGTSLLVASAAIFGPLAGWFAARRARHPVTWLALGALLGPIAIVLLAVAPPGRCMACDAATRGWPSRCQVCGTPFTTSGPFASSGMLPPATAAGTAAPSSEGPAPNAAASQMGVPTPFPVASTRRRNRGNRPYLEPRPMIPTGRPSPPRPQAPAPSGEILATGVYFGGSARLVVGSRYAIVRDGPVLRFMGPLDHDPTKVALEYQLDRLTATAIEDRLVVSDGGSDGFAFAIGSIAGRTPGELEAALGPGDTSSTTRSAYR